jgi:hypothetical protein
MSLEPGEASATKSVAQRRGSSSTISHDDSSELTLCGEALRLFDEWSEELLVDATGESKL